MKKLLALFLALGLCLPVAACGNPQSGGPDGGTETGDSTKIVIYVGGSSEYTVVKGSDEDRVIEAVEQKYYEDTQVKLDFEVNYLGSSMMTSLPSALSGGTQIDIVISHAKGGNGIDDFVISNDAYYDLADLLSEYGSSILEKSSSAMSNVTTIEGNVIGFPSVIDPYKYGILVRKDYMEQAGYTDDPEKVSEGKILVDNLEDFTDMCIKMKEITKYSYSVTGAIWDLEKSLVTGAYADGGYFNFVAKKDASGNITSVLPGFALDEYAEILAQEYRWVAEDEIISKDANSLSLSLAEQEFISGKTGVFLTDPSINHLITVARKTKAYAEEQNKTAEFTVLPPLKATKTSTKKGYVRNSEATFIASVMYKSKNAEAIVKFVNWMYSNEENYRLCKYGIEGVHYIDNKDGTYSYPEGKDEYFTSQPYSGILALVENQNVCDLKYDGYTDEEKEWIAIAADKDNYVDNNVVDYLMPANEEMNNIYDTARNRIYIDLAIPAWNGRSDPLGILESVEGKPTRFQQYKNKYLEEATDYTSWVTNMYKILIQKYSK